MAVLPWYRRYWGYSNRPYTGCGCLYLLVLLLVLWLIVSLILWPIFFAV